MTKMPIFDDIDETENEQPVPTIKVPKGWAVEADEDEDTTGDPVTDEFGTGYTDPNDADTDGDAPVVTQTMPSFGDEDDIDVPDDADIADIDDAGQEVEPPVRTKLSPKYDTVTEKPVGQPKKRAWVDDWDKDDVPPVVSRPKKKTSWAVEDYDDEVPAKGKPMPIDGSGEVVPLIDTTDTVVSGGGEVPVVTKTMPVFDDTDDQSVPAPVAVAKPKPVKKLSVTRLSERAMLVSLNISQWSGRRFDRKVSDEVNQRKAANAKAGRYTKALLPECVELEEIHRQTSSMRNWFVDQTLPWMNDGARIMPSSKYLTFNVEFRQRKALWDAAFAAFEAAYPALLAKAPSQLPGMFDADDYPHQSELAAKFSMAVRVLPLPDRADFRLDLDDKTMAEINAGMADHENDLATIVAADCVLRLSKVVSAMAERLADKDAVFRDSLVDNIVEAVAVISDLNITDDPEVEALRAETEAKLAVYTPDELRIDMSKRRAAAKAAADIAAKMGALMGQP